MTDDDREGLEPEYAVLVDRVALHAALDRWIDVLVLEQPMLEDGHEHVITFSGGGVERDADGILITDFTITTQQTRHV